MMTPIRVRAEVEVFCSHPTCWSEVGRWVSAVLVMSEVDCVPGDTVRIDKADTPDGWTQRESNWVEPHYHFRCPLHPWEPSE